MGTTGVLLKQRVTEHHGRQLAESFFLHFALGRLISFKGYLFGLKNSVNWVGKFLQWKGEFWIQEAMRARLDTSIDEVVSRRCKLCKQVDN